MPFHPAPPLPRSLADQLPVGRGSFELACGPDAGRELHFIDDGDRDAPAVVMIHGNPTWSFLWRKVIGNLRGTRCVAPDLLGFGFSSRLPKIADHSIGRHADALAELIEALELKRFVIVGQDWGGPISASLAARLPQRVAGAVFANTSILPPRHPRMTAFHRFAQTPWVSDVVFRGLGFPQNILWLGQGDRLSIRGRVARAYRWPLRKISDRVGPLALARMVPNSAVHRSMDELHRGSAWARAFDGPMALVWGTRDPIFRRALARHQKTFPQAPVTVTRAGHFLQEEVPVALADAIRDVWDRA